MVSAQQRPAKVPSPMVVVLLAALAAFGGSIVSGFHFDDYGMLQDPAVSSAGGWLRCWSLLQTRPLTWFSFWLNYQLSGRDPLLWHVVNLALHAACALMLYNLLRRVMPDVALFGALLFSVHPIQAESVDYVFARATLLCALFSLLTVNEWLRGRHWIAVAWFALALLSKEECVTLPLVLGLNAWLCGRLRPRIFPLTAMLGTAALAGVRVLVAIQATGTNNIGVNAGISPLGYLSVEGIAILRYCGLLVFPWFFTVDPWIPSPSWEWRMLAWMVVGCLIAAAMLRFWSLPSAFFILAGFILLVPSSSVFPAADLAADRRMYLPMLALAPAIALLMPVGRTRWIALLCCALTALSVGRTWVWASDQRLWGEAVRLAPGKVRPRIQFSRAVPPEQALGILQDAARLAPEDSAVPTELARVYLELHRPAEALAQSGRALALTPREPHALSNRGAILLAMGQTAAGRRDFLAALSVDSCLQEARSNLEQSGGIPPDAPPCASSLR